MGQIKQSVGWWCFAQGGMTIERLVRAAVDIGYEAIELVEQEHWPLVKDHGLAIASMRGQTSLEKGFNRREHHEHWSEKSVLISP
jgi:hydroxypyruvate isomerase